MKTEIKNFWARIENLHQQTPRVCESCGVRNGEEIGSAKRRKHRKFAVVAPRLRVGGLMSPENACLLCEKCVSAGQPPPRNVKRAAPIRREPLEQLGLFA